MSSQKIKKDMYLFQSAIKNLSDDIGKASSLWNDAKYAELSASISEIATQSREYMVFGERCCASIDKFDKVAAEKY